MAHSPRDTAGHGQAGPRPGQEVALQLSTHYIHEI